MRGVLEVGAEQAPRGELCPGQGLPLALVPEVAQRLRDAGLQDVPLVAGGIIPEADAERLRGEGIAAVYTPKDFEITGIIRDIADVAGEQLKNVA